MADILTNERKGTITMSISAQLITGIVILILLVAAAVFALLFRRRSRSSMTFEDMEGHEFEYFCADLLKSHGFYEVEVTKGSGDYGIDILAEKDGVTYAVQCKRYTAPVGVKAVQEAYAGRDYYDRMVGAVMTNQYFTAPAVEAAKKLKILLWDGGYLESMMEEN
ncbi:MAG: restriction endonuclease [Suilimivivens sp.]